MSEFKCNFCGSKELKVQSPYVELKSNGEYGPIENFCCQAQKQNALYVKKNFHPDDAPDPDEVSKW
jgi:hypothetical protein